MTLEQLKMKYPAGKTRPVLITEVTRMNNGFYCVAGFDLHAAKMIRPLHTPASNWRLVDRKVFSPGHVVECEYTGSRGNGAYPHRTEDTVLARMPRVLETVGAEEIHTVLSSSLFDSVAQLYDGLLIDDKYVNDGTRCRSLGGVVVPVEKLRFEESFDKLRLRIFDTDGRHYSLGVTSDELRTRFHDDRATSPAVDDANEWLDGFSAGSRALLRLGLARGWDKYNPKRCYLQLNGLLIA